MLEYYDKGFPMEEWPKYYILSNRVPLAVDLMTWARWFDNFENRQVALSEFGNVRVSTVFLGLNHNLGDGEPILFETLVMGGPLDGTMGRYRTWIEAEQGHAEIVTDAKLASAKIKAIADQAGAKS